MISTVAKKIAEEISIVKKSHPSTHSFFCDYFYIFNQDYADLKHCPFFHLSPELLSMLWEIILTERCPNSSMMLALELKGLGKLSMFGVAKEIPDPCGSKCGYERIVACFIENLIMDCNSQSATVQGYTSSIDNFFEMRDFPIPTSIVDKENIVSKISHTCKRKETIARQKSPITKEMYNAIS
jgi:hypothetical protein